MKIARFSVDGWKSYGRVEGDRVRVIQGDIFGEHPGIAILRNPVVAEK